MAQSQSKPRGSKSKKQDDSKDKKTSEVDKKTSEVDKKTSEVDKKTPEVNKKTPEVNKKTPEVNKKTSEEDKKASEVKKNPPEANTAKLDFSWMANQITPKEPLWKGLMLPLSTIFSVFFLSLAITGSWWLWEGALLTLPLFMPAALTVFVALTGLTILNWFFNREIMTSSLGAKEIRTGNLYDKHNQIDVIKLTNHVRQEFNAYCRSKDPKHVDIPMPRLCTFTDHHFKIETCLGRNPGKAAIFFSSGSLNSHDTGLNQRQLAALIQKELVKIYMRRSVSGLILAMGEDLLVTLDAMKNGNLFYKCLAFLAGPLQFFLLLQRAILRSYEYQASGVVAKELLRGFDLYEAMDKVGCPSLFKKRTNVQLKEDQQQNRRPPYNGPLKAWIRPITDWFDRKVLHPNEWTGDDKTGWRIISFIEIVVREIGYLVEEAFKKNPRGPNVKAYLRPIIGLDKAKTDEDVQAIRQKERVANKKLYDKIPKKDRYEPIGPNGNGKVKTPESKIIKIHDKLADTEKKIAELTEELAALKAKHTPQNDADKENKSNGRSGRSTGKTNTNKKPPLASSVRATT